MVIISRYIGINVYISYFYFDTNDYWSVQVSQCEYVKVFLPCHVVVRLGHAGLTLGSQHPQRDVCSSDCRPSTSTWCVLVYWALHAWLGESGSRCSFFVEIQGLESNKKFSVFTWFLPKSDGFGCQTPQTSFSSKNTLSVHDFLGAWGSRRAIWKWPMKLLEMTRKPSSKSRKHFAQVRKSKRTGSGQVHIFQVWGSPYLVIRWQNWKADMFFIVPREWVTRWQYQGKSTLQYLARVSVFIFRFGRPN